MRKYTAGTYSVYRPTYTSKVLEDGNCLRGLLKREKTNKDLYNAYFRVTDSLSCRITALTNTHYVRFELMPLNVILEVSTKDLLDLQKVLKLKDEDKAYIQLDQAELKLISGPSNWAELLRKIPAPPKKKNKKWGKNSPNWGIYANIG